MLVILGASILAVVAGLVVPLRHRRGTENIDFASLLALACLGDLIALFAAILVGLSDLLRHEDPRPALVTGALALLGLVISTLWHSHATRPRGIPRHVTPTWNIPTTPTSQLMVHLLEVTPGEPTTLVVITSDGAFHTLTTPLDAQRCLDLEGHRCVLLLDATHQGVDIIDLGVVEDEPAGPTTAAEAPRTEQPARPATSHHDEPPFEAASGM